MNRLILSALGVLVAPLVAETHGPIVQWYRSPSTSAALLWIEHEAVAAKPGAWAVGQAGFGYGDDDDKTVLQGMKGKYRSVFLRKSLELKSIPKDAKLLVRGYYDDGLIVYLNGKEVVRQRVEGEGNVVQRVDDHEATKWERFDVGAADGLLKAGKNVIAVECHNKGLNSSDLSVDVSLVLVAGGKRKVLLQPGSRWEYLYGAVPGDGWKMRAGEIGVDPSADLPEAQKLKFRPKGAGDWVTRESERRLFGDSGAWVHSVDLDGLQPASSYEFELEGGSKGWFQTAPTEVPDGTSFVTGGDMMHTVELLDAMNRRAGKEDPMFALLGGDLAYANGLSASRWYQWVDSWTREAVAPDGRMIPMVVAIGNHEVKGMAYAPKNPPPTSEAPYFYSLFKLPEGVSNYSLDFGKSLSLVMLDSGHTQSISSQTDWLRETLQARQGAKRTYVCYHRPAWGTGVKPDAVDVQDEWGPLFEQYGVDAVFENDHHVYKRTKPLLAGKVDESNGIPYIGDGAWGVNVRVIPAEELKKRDWLAHQAPKNHLIRVTMNADGATYDAMTAAGEIFDTFEYGYRK
ncbi:metallophosphoesterase [Haloferula rosea]|uniref:Metallophosphoesterase n=1 Tax=Haloferula rosea TaxID=490093 RepID=A0A934VFD1_9BACT|nr:metallophosphoesterase [Haloferula rosea]MBK1826936.1 metallophosphoesterase [Haloferula rosea]